ncbi:hypothetical protein [Devosia sp.]|uniref:hypothetical protein n=1 Tax=Devosia sp. TaxID=1871048 RepID=UPI002732EC9C|nr:hypothetical protein [Devosia sp.]MDP2779277.1 hypothetical protein [Devosia sp.]
MGSPILSAAEAQTVALIRESKAQDAINASSLAAVVEALKRKKVKFRSAIIEDGGRSFDAAMYLWRNPVYE